MHIDTSGNILRLDNDTGSITLKPDEEEQLFKWFMSNRQRMVLKVACERCDEQAEYHAYCELKQKITPEQVMVVCHKCGYPFNSKSKLIFVGCPSCNTKTLRIKPE